MLRHIFALLLIFVGEEQSFDVQPLLLLLLSFAVPSSGLTSK